MGWPKETSVAGGVISRFLRDPIGYSVKVFRKLFIDRWRYARGRDYDAAAYWRDRFTRYGTDIRGPGHEGLSKEENEAMYQEAGEVFLAVCRREGVRWADARVLEIGCGTGFYTRLLADQGVTRLTAVDITDVQFPRLRSEFPRFEFIQRDVGCDDLTGTFDLVIMIDVAQHLVDDGKFSHAMLNVKRCLADGGVFIVNPVADRDSQTVFYVRFRCLDAFQREFPGYVVAPPVPFRGQGMVSIRR